jgi:hypothetical protein
MAFAARVSLLQRRPGTDTGGMLPARSASITLAAALATSALGTDPIGDGHGADEPAERSPTGAMLAAFPDRSPYRTSAYDPAYAAFVGAHLRALGTAAAMDQISNFVASHDDPVVADLASQLVVETQTPMHGWSDRMAIRFIGGLPYLLPAADAGGGGIGGGAPTPLQCVHAWRTAGAERSDVPAPDDRPALALIAFILKEGGHEGRAPASAAIDDATAFRLAQQLSRAVASAIPEAQSTIPSSESCSSPPRDETLALLRELDSHRVRWNPAIGRYTRLDGSYDELQAEFREPVLSVFTFDGWMLRILIERESSRRVLVRAIVEPRPGATTLSTVIRLTADGETKDVMTLASSDTSFVQEERLDIAPETTLEFDVDTGSAVRRIRHCP